MRQFLADRTGVTSIEYALIAGFVSLAIVLGLTTIGTTINAKFFGPLMSGFH